MTEARDRLDGESMVSRYTYDDAEGTIEVSLAGGGLFGRDVAARVRALLPEDEYMIRPVADDADTLTIIVLGV